MNINLIWSLSWRHNHKHTAWKRSRVTSPGPTSWHSSYSSLHPQGPEVGWRLFWLHRIPAWTLTCLQTNNSQPPSPVMLKEISLWWTLTSFCSLCRHSSSVSSISLSANIHTHTEAKCREKQREMQFISWGYLWVWNTGCLKPENAAFPYCSLCTCLGGSKGWDDANGMFYNFPSAK